MQELNNTKIIKILLVEDDDIIVKVHSKMLEKILASTHHLIDIARNAEDALKLFQSTNSYNLIITDIGLPNMSGIEMVATVRQIEIGKNKTPIIAISGYTNKIKEECISAGANDVYSKPISIVNLKMIIEKFIDLN